MRRLLHWLALLGISLALAVLTGIGWSTAAHAKGGGGGGHGGGGHAGGHAAAGHATAHAAPAKAAPAPAKSAPVPGYVWWHSWGGHAPAQDCPKDKPDCKR
jgi:hypothetical protein